MLEENWGHFLLNPGPTLQIPKTATMYRILIKKIVLFFIIPIRSLCRVPSLRTIRPTNYRSTAQPQSSDGAVSRKTFFFCSRKTLMPDLVLSVLLLRCPCLFNLRFATLALSHLISSIWQILKLLLQIFQNC